MEKISTYPNKLIFHTKEISHTDFPYEKLSYTCPKKIHTFVREKKLTKQKIFIRTCLKKYFFGKKNILILAQKNYFRCVLSCALY